MKLEMKYVTSDFLINSQIWESFKFFTKSVLNSQLEIYRRSVIRTLFYYIYYYLERMSYKIIIIFYI